MIKRIRKMKWQDAVFSVGEVVFATGLIPSVTQHNPPAPITSASTAIMLMAFCFVHYSYKLWLTLTLTMATIGAWWWLFLQGIGVA